MNGYNFTERVRKVLAFAREASANLRHEYVGTEHILLGVIREGEGVAATVLQNLSVELDELRFTIEQTVKKGQAGKPSGPDLPYTSRAKKVLELAMSQARELNHSYVGTEHLLLGLIAEKKGIAAQVLADAGVNLDNARAETVRILGTEVPSKQTGKTASETETVSFTRRRPAGSPDSPGGIEASVQSERLREVLTDGENVATECKSPQALPIHVAVALVRHGEGFANAILDRLGVDRPALLRALENEAKRDASPALPDGLVNLSQYMLALQRYIVAEGRWRSSPPSTLHALLAFLDTEKEIAAIFAAHGVDANRVRTEARRMTG